MALLSSPDLLILAGFKSVSIRFRQRKI